MSYLILFSTFSTLIGVLYWWRFDTVFNPPSLVCFGLSASNSFALVLNYIAQSGWPLHAGFVGDPAYVAIIYSVGLMTFLIPWALPVKRKVRGLNSSTSALNSKLLILNFCLGSLLVLIWVQLGGVPIYGMLVGSISIVDHLENLHNLATGEMMLSLLLTTVLALYVASYFASPKIPGRSRAVIILSLAIIFIACIWQGNRQAFLIFIFIFCARKFIEQGQKKRYGFGGSQTKRWLLRLYFMGAIVFFLVFFIVMNYLRLAKLGVSSGPFELLLYFSWPVYNMTSVYTHIGFEGIGNYQYLLTELLPARWGGKSLMLELSKLYFEPTSPSGFFSYWFLSFGLLGVALGGALLGFAARYFFVRSELCENNMRKYILMLWCCASVAIYSHFLSLAYFWGPLIFLALVEIFFQAIPRRTKIMYRSL